MTETETEVDAAHVEMLEMAAEALEVIAADNRLAAAFAAIAAAKRETKAATDLYEALKSEVAAHQRAASWWKKKAQKAAICKACRVNLDRDEEA